MQRLTDQQKTELVEQGHGWKTELDGQQEVALVFFNNDHQYSCACSNGLIDNFDFWHMEHQEHCVLSVGFNVIHARLINT